MTMTTTITENTGIRTPTDLSTLAVLINQTHAGAYEAASTALEYARCCGELLSQAKGQLKHGQWLPWLKANTKVSTRTAQLYMQVATHAEELQADTQRVAHLGLRKAIHWLGRQKQIAERRQHQQPASLVYTSPDGQQHWGAEAVHAALPAVSLVDSATPEEEGGSDITSDMTPLRAMADELTRAWMAIDAGEMQVAEGVLKAIAAKLLALHYNVQVARGALANGDAVRALQVLERCEVAEGTQEAEEPEP